MDLKYGFGWIENFESISINFHIPSLLVPVRLIVDLKISFVLNSTGHIQFYNVYTNNLLYSVRKILLKNNTKRKLE